MSAEPSLRSRAMHGAFWSVLRMGAGRALRLASNLVTTRLLSPEAFGLMALVNIFRTGLTQLSDLGIAPSVVRSPRGDDPEFLRTAWSLQVARGGLLWALACLLAAPTARFYAQPELASLVPVAALVLVLDGLQSASLLRYRRHLSLKQITLIDLAGQVISVAVMIAWAWQWRTVWALVAGTLASGVFRTCASFLVDRGRLRHRLRWERDAVRELVHFGKWIFLSTVLSFLAGHLDRFIFGKTIPIAMLGVYSIAFMLATLPSEIVTTLGRSVVFPALSRKLEQSGQLASVYPTVRLPVLGLSALGVAALVAVGPALIETLYDPRFHEAGWMLQILAAGTWLRALEVPAGSALLALGLPRAVAFGHGAKALAIATLVPLGFAWNGFPGALWGLAAAQLPLYLFVAGAAARRGLSAFGDDLAWTALIALSAGAGLEASTASALGGPPLRLLAGLGVTAGVWTVGAAALLRLRGQSLRALLRPTSVAP